MQTPPPGVALTTDVMRRDSGIVARVRWFDPDTGIRRSRSLTCQTEDQVATFFERMKSAVATGIDPGITFGDYVASLGGRWMRGIDGTSTADPYRAGLTKRIVPALGHLPVRLITAGLIDRTIDAWEADCGSSTLKNTVAALVRVLDEAVRDGLIPTNPARSRSRRAWNRVPDRTASPRSQALADLPTLMRLVDAVKAVEPVYGTWVMLCALLSARGSEVNGLLVGDVDLVAGLVHIRRQVYPGAGGLVTKQTKGRAVRTVPIVEPLRPVLHQLVDGRPASAPLVRGPKGGVITTASLRRATNWNALVTGLGLAGLRRHDLRHTGATWMADAGVPLHVLREILGHRSLETTRGYLHTDTRHLTDAATAVNAFLSASGSQTGHSGVPTLRIIDGRR